MGVHRVWGLCPALMESRLAVDQSMKADMPRLGAFLSCAQEAGCR